jgi:GNAT superfamily N-acetyltransferase
MLYEAAFWRPDEPRPGLDEALADPALGRYIENWGRRGDEGFVELDECGEPIGAAWYRLFGREAPGYGFVDEQTPELTIGVVAEARRHGVGRRLLRALTESARHDGYEGLSLSVESDNPARALYERHGFIRVGGDSAWTMRIDLRL